MYDFRFGSIDEIRESPEEFVLFVKHLLPRWLNGITDEQCLAIFRCAASVSQSKGVLIETGCGASTVPLVVHAALTGDKAFSWDISGHKGSQLRLVLTEAVGLALGVDINEVWHFVAADSCDPLVGIKVLGELGQNVKMGFFDSQHTLNQLVAEVNSTLAVANDSLVVALDDAYYRSISQNYGYRNLQRVKLGLAPIEEPKENLGDEFRDVIGSLLEVSFTTVRELTEMYRADPNDVHLRYFSSDRKVFGKIGMENPERLSDRFTAWSCSGKNSRS